MARWLMTEPQAEDLGTDPDAAGAEGAEPVRLALRERVLGERGDPSGADADQDPWE